MIGSMLFLSCQSFVNFNIGYKFKTLKDRYFIFYMYAYSTNDYLSNDSKVNDLVTLTLTFTQKIAFLTLLL